MSLTLFYILTLVGAADDPLLTGAALHYASGIQTNCNNQHRSIRLDPARNINYDLPLAGAADSLPLSGTDIPPAGSILININNINHDIHLDPVLKLHEFDGQ